MCAAPGANNTVEVTRFINTIVAPVVLANIGYCFHIFFGLGCFRVGVHISYFVETKGRTLKELDGIFESRSPRKKSIAMVVTRKRVTRKGMKLR